MKLLYKLTYNIFFKKHIYFLKNEKLFKQKLLMRKIRIKFKNLKEIQLKKNINLKHSKYKTYFKNKSLIGQVLLISTNNQILTLISMFYYKKKKQNTFRKQKSQKKKNNI